MVKITLRIVFIISLLITVFCSAYSVDNSVFFKKFKSNESFQSNCVKPNGLAVSTLGTDFAVINWLDSSNASWEYYVQDAGYPIPTGIGVSTNTLSNHVTTDIGGNLLIPDTYYEFYVRSICASNTIVEWVGPFSFKTYCNTMVLPFFEDFETSSTTAQCWIAMDNNKDGTATANKWKVESTATSAYAGLGSMYFNGINTGKAHDDLLISPSFQFNSNELYELTFYYKTFSTASTEFEILLSVNGIEPANFTKIVESKQVYKSSSYLKKTVYIENTVGKVNLAWRVSSSGSSPLYIDNISLKKVSCKAPSDEIQLLESFKDKVIFKLTDSYNSEWEYAVGMIGAGVPIGSGSKTTTTTISANRVSVGGTGNLLPDTEYEFWCRSACGVGKSSSWIGPLKFRTGCDIIMLPFLEGFNKSSSTIQCWNIIDGNNDETSSNNSWKVSTLGAFEGDQMMYFNGLNLNTIQLPHNDWLITPSFQFNATKYYRIKYHYKTSATSKVDYTISLSSSGTKIPDFSKVLDSKTAINSTAWKQEKLVVGGISGIVNLAWQITTKTSSSQFYIDQISIEEIDCPEPSDFIVKNEKDSEVTISWVDDLGSKWEYAVQDIGAGVPLKGTITTNTEVIVDKLTNGASLVHSTEYEYYVRTVCSSSVESVWFGPFKFKTACGIYPIPFWEGFNVGSKSLSCWTIIDGNQDSTSPTSANIWKSNTLVYEGSGSMLFQGNQASKVKLPHNDWLISPTIKFIAGKQYRLKFHYKTLITSTNDYEFEVLLSNKGIDLTKFTTTVIPRKKYNPSQDWVQEYVFISGVDGESNLAWHVTSSTSGTYLLVDNIFVEEVIGCAEPLNLDSSNITSKSSLLSWTDTNQATKFEYFVSKEGKGVPAINGTSTTAKSVSVVTEQNGTALKPNTMYEFYVRTDCGNGKFSIWNGPFKFETICETFTTPYMERFNYVDNTFKCWTTVDGNNDATLTNNEWRVHTNLNNVYEGDQAMYFYGSTSKTDNDWLISPRLSLSNGLYMLKYYYKTNALFANDFEVLLSNSGISTDLFTTSVVDSKIYKNSDYVEEVAYFTTQADDIYLGWHVKSTGTTHVYIDQISLTKIETCPAPYHLKFSNHTSTGIDLTWSQYGAVTSWEVIVVEFGNTPTGTIIQKMIVTNTPQVSILGLVPGKAYTIYVRSNCTKATEVSEWSLPADTATIVGLNDECIGAVTIPVNQKSRCIQTMSGSLNGATTSSIVRPSCYSTLKNDVWYEFTATSTEHILSAPTLKSLKSNSATIVVALYNQTCQAITSNAIECFGLTSGEQSNYKVLSNLTIGQKYMLRIGLAPFATDVQVFFDLCVTTPESVYISKNGDDYHLDELVKNVFTQTDCKLVSNIKYQNGDGSTAAQLVNTLGYFSKANSIFPFAEGIVLSTGEVEFAKGPFTYDNKGNNPFRWSGDKDLMDAINDAGGMPSVPKKVKDMRVTQLSFDLIPMRDSIHFEYLFASNSYLKDCDYTCNNGALFAAWLVDDTTGVGVNLAKVKGTNQPIALNTILDVNKTGGDCESVNPQYYWNHYLNNQISPIEAPFNFVGSTQALTSETVGVMPGRKYHIKLAVMDFCQNKNHTSAVFFNAGSFDLGSLKLGSDRLISTNNAICFGDNTVIRSGFNLDSELEMEIQWFKDGVLLQGEKKPDLEVNKPGKYEIKIVFPELECESIGAIIIEYYPDLKQLVNKPETIEVCRNSIQDLKIDLTQVEYNMFSQVERTAYHVTYYTSEIAALESKENITEPSSFNIGRYPKETPYYIRVNDLDTGCNTIFELNVLPKKGELPVKLDIVSVCSRFTLPTLAENQYYYSEPNGGGKKYKSGDVLDIPGKHTVYVLQINNEQGCFEEVVFEINITAEVNADQFDDVIMSCGFYELPQLSEYNKYYTKSGANGDQLQVGNIIYTEQKIYVFASSLDGLCIDESSFKIKYEDCPIPKGISPNGDGLNDLFDLGVHGVSKIQIFNRSGTEVYTYIGNYKNQWYGQTQNGKILPSGTYYYIVYAFDRIRTGWVEIIK